jgi:hypothetical protein
LGKKALLSLSNLRGKDSRVEEQLLWEKVEACGVRWGWRALLPAVDPIGRLGPRHSKSSQLWVVSVFELSAV